MWLRLFDVHFRGAIGSPRVAGSTMRSRAGSKDGCFSWADFRPPPGRRCRPPTTPSSGPRGSPCSSRLPCKRVIGLISSASAIARTPPRPNDSASLAAHSLFLPSAVSAAHTFLVSPVYVPHAPSNKAAAFLAYRLANGAQAWAGSTFLQDSPSLLYHENEHLSSPNRSVPGYLRKATKYAGKCGPPGPGSRSVLDETLRPPERLHVMPVLSGLLLFEFFFCPGQVGGIPIGTVLMNGGLKLANMFGGRFQLEIGHAIDVD